MTPLVPPSKLNLFPDYFINLLLIVDFYNRLHAIFLCFCVFLAIAGHDHVMNVTAQLARNSGVKVRVNRKVDTTAADNNKQGDVQAMDFGIPSIWYGMCLL